MKLDTTYVTAHGNVWVVPDEQALSATGGIYHLPTEIQVVLLFKYVLQ